MGFTIPLSSNNFIEQKNINKKSIFKKILIRSISLFIIGISVFSIFGVHNYDLNNIRIPGVLQRISICYLIVSCLDLLFYCKKLFCWKQFLVILLLELTWLTMTFYYPVPNCPKGYLEPGGLHANGSYYNCTGGIAGYLDKILLGKNHLYKR